MKVILLATVVAIVLAIGAAYVMDSRFQHTVAESFTTTGARIE
jgi:predicted alpha/beta-hydrolase family hydrolase